MRKDIMDKPDKTDKLSKTSKLDKRKPDETGEPDKTDKPNKVNNMEKIEKEALQVSKEITVKFIEIQRVSPNNFADIFPNIYEIVLDTIIKGREKFSSSTQLSSTTSSASTKK